MGDFLFIAETYNASRSDEITMRGVIQETIYLIESIKRLITN